MVSSQDVFIMWEFHNSQKKSNAFIPQKEYKLCLCLGNNWHTKRHCLFYWQNQKFKPWERVIAIFSTFLHWLPVTDSLFTRNLSLVLCKPSQTHQHAQHDELNAFKTVSDETRSWWGWRNKKLRVSDCFRFLWRHLLIVVILYASIRWLMSLYCVIAGLWVYLWF